ncbi:MAG TPA: Ig-like domain-containing protein, partial [Gemmatimonadales bacterium]|nr:Ig-like domain-containing protein [Gemmatimonadales bacterium]
AFDIASAGAAGIAANVAIPANTAPGGTVSPTPSVKVTDAGGNPVAGVTVTFTPLDGSTATGTTQVTSAQGIATVGSWTIGTSAGATYRLRATADGVGGEVIFSTTASGGLAILTQPSATVESGQVFPQQPVIQLRDASGSPVALAGVEVVATISSGGGTLGGTTTVSTDAQGQATFTNLSITGSPGTRRLLFAASGFTAVTSAEIAVTAPGVSQAQSSFTADPAAVTVGAPSTLTVTLRDQSGAPVPGVSISLGTDASGTFGSTTLTSGSDGTASTTYTPAAEGVHTLTASAQAAGLTTAVTALAAGG